MVLQAKRTLPPLLPLAGAEAIVLQAETAWLNDRIDRRFAGMLKAGALDEARTNLVGWDPKRPSSRAIGGPELVAYLHGETGRDAAVAAAILSSRQYAKRQRTWFRSNMQQWNRVIVS